MAPAAAPIEKVQIVGLDTQVINSPGDEQRRDVIHAVVIVRMSWVTFAGGWKNDEAGAAAALRFALSEGRARGATRIQIARRPKYDAEFRSFVYESVDIYEPDGTFVYSK